MANWRGFEQLAALIYSELTPQAQVVHNDHIAGRDSGVPRQIDVSIRYAIAGHDLLIIVQAKDYSEPTDINTVGEFATVISDVRANKGVLICRGGFTSGAQALANNRGIDLCNLHDAESRDWRLDISLPILWIDLLPTVQFGIEEAHFEAGDSIPSDPQDWVLSVDRGKTRLLPFKTFVDAWNARRLAREVGPWHRLVPAGLSNLTVEPLQLSSAPVSGLAE